MLFKKRYGYGGVYAQKFDFIFRWSCWFYIEFVKEIFWYIVT